MRTLCLIICRLRGRTTQFQFQTKVEQQAQEEVLDQEARDMDTGADTEVAEVAEVCRRR